MDFAKTEADRIGTELDALRARIGHELAGIDESVFSSRNAIKDGLEELKTSLYRIGIAVTIAILIHAGVTFWALDNLAGWLA